MEPFDAIYCPLEDIVVVDDDDLAEFTGTCPNCLEEGAVVVEVKEKV